jgi:TetR/AcrR family transcriptional regulator, transcriptional repressor for nem operon
MPRSKSHSKETLLSAAMQQFWAHGYAGSSMDDLVRVTDVSRHGIYSEFGGKQQLFLSCLSVYQAQIVTPAFSQVETEGAGLSAIAAFYEFQISRGERRGLPGPGCFIANTLSEFGTSDADVSAVLCAHNERLRAGFWSALRNEQRARGGRSKPAAAELAGVLVPFTHGLWTLSRSEPNAAVLRGAVKTLLQIIQERLSQ